MRAIDIDLLDNWLDEWAHSMRSYRPDMLTVCNDAPWRNAMHAVNEDYQDVVEDRRMSGIVDALDSCIDSLHAHQRGAIWRAYEQIKSWPWPAIDYDQALAAGKQSAGTMMRERGYTC